MRTSWVYSNHGKNFLLTIARLAAERKQLRIVSDQFGAPTSARVIADALVRILRLNRVDTAGAFARGCGVVNIASSETTSWHGFATAIVAGMKQRAIAIETEQVLPIETDEYPTKATRPRNSRLDLGRLHEVFGIKTRSARGARH